MSNRKFSELPLVSTVTAAAEFPVNEGGTATKKVSITQLTAYLETLGKPRIWSLGSQHNNSTTTGTSVGTIALEAGTYYYYYCLICQAAATGTGIRLGINFTGTAATRTMMLRYPSTGTGANTGVADDVGSTAGQLWEAFPHTAFSTTAPNMGNAGVATANSSYPAFIEGNLVVTVAGNLELWHASSAAAQTSLIIGSSGYVIRCV